MSHPFGDLLTRYRSRKHGLSQARLAETIGLDAAVITYMCQGKQELTGRSGRGRVLKIIHALVEFGAIDSLAEANALLDAGEMDPLNRRKPEEAALIARLPPARPAAIRAGEQLEHGPEHSNLPVQLTSFVGRKRELAEITQHLTSTRLLTISGVGGCGKTRLAVETAVQMARVYPDGTVFVDLAPLSEPDQVVPAIAAVLNLRLEAEGRSLQSLAAALRTRSILILLDNCEHLLNISARLAEHLLSVAPGISILATSREPLHIAGESVYRLAPLSLPPPELELSISEHLLTYDSIRLFCARASAQRPGFALTAENAAAVLQICRTLDGLPLAIELAATLLIGLSVEQVANRLGDPYRLLVDGSRTSHPRHQTLRALVDWSYTRLSEHERSMFRRLAVFPGEWSLEAAEYVTGFAEAEESNRDSVSGNRDALDLYTLLQLVKKSLVIAVPAGSVTRYRMLETIRYFAYEKLLEAGEEIVARIQMLDYFVKFTEQAEKGLQGTRQELWLASVTDEFDSISIVLAWAQQHDPEAGLRIAGSLGFYWFYTGRVQMGQIWLERLLATTQPVNDAVRAKALDWFAFFLSNNGATEQAINLAEEGLQLRRRLEDVSGVADSLSTLAHIEQCRHNYTRARTFLMESLELRRQTGSQGMVATALANLADTYIAQDEYDQAGPLLDECLVLARAITYPVGIGRALLGLAILAWKRGDIQQARTYLEEGLQLSRALGANTGIYLNLQLQGYLEAQQGDLEPASGYFKQALQLARVLNSPIYMAQCLIGLAEVTLARGELRQALRLLGAGATTAQSEEGPLFMLYGRLTQDSYKRSLAAIQNLLEQEIYAAEWHAGKTRPLAEVVDEILGD